MAEQARYQVRTPMFLWLTNGLLIAICVVILGAMLMFNDSVPGFLLLIMTVLTTSTFGFWASMTAYRVGGGRNLIRFYEDRVEVPGPKHRKPLVFPREGSTITIGDVLVRYRLGIAGTVGSVKRGKLIELSRPGLSRKLSTLVLDDEADEAPLVADLERFLDGEAALGREGHAKASLIRGDYDDRLDRELAQLD